MSNLEHDFQTPQPNKADVIPLRLKLLANGYHPVPVLGKVPAPMKGWQNVCKTAAEYEIRRWSRDYSNCVNTGILGGLVVAPDIDVLVPELAERLAFKCAQILGHSPLRRVGRAPKILFCYRVEAPIRKLSTPALILDDGGEHKVEILAEGQQFVAFGVHPDTGQPYRWGEQSPLDTPLSELPLVTLEKIQHFVAEAEKIIRAAGGRTKSERDQENRQDHQQQEEARRDEPTPRPKTSAVDKFGFPIADDDRGENFFRSVNDAAMQNLGRWAPDLLPKAELQGTGAWRVSSKNLGRNLQEDLSIAPEGIVDFGVADQGDPRQGKRTPIDLVLEHGGQSTPADAAKWLCERLGVDPATIGWRGGTASGSGAQRDDQPAGDKPREARFKFETADEIFDLPDASYLVQRYVPEKSVGLLIGKWGARKTFLGFSWALHLAYGLEDWFGYKLPGKPTDVLIIAREGASGFKRRIQAFRTHHGLKENPKNLIFLRSPVNFADEASFKELKESIKALNRPFGFVLTDTVGRAIPGVDMAKEQFITLFMERLQQVGEVTGGTSVGVHHENKSGDATGSMFFQNSSDFMFSVTKEGDDAKLLGKISCLKMKDDEGQWSQQIEYQKVCVPDPFGLSDKSSLVVSKVFGNGAADDGAPPPSVKMFMDCIDEATISNVVVHHIPDGPAVRAAKLDDVRSRHSEVFIHDGKGDRGAAARQAWKRAVSEAQKRNLIGSETRAGVELIWRAREGV